MDHVLFPCSSISKGRATVTALDFCGIAAKLGERPAEIA
jgi:hypothetical protein